MEIGYLYSTSDLTFVVRVQNYVKWVEFSANHFVEYRIDEW